MSTTSGIGLAICVTLLCMQSSCRTSDSLPLGLTLFNGLEAWQGPQSSECGDRPAGTRIYYLRVNTKDGQEKEDKVHLNDDILTGFFVCVDIGCRHGQEDCNTWCRRV